MQTRRPGKQTDHKVSPGALAAIAEAARRSREAGVGPEPRRSRGERPPAGGVTDQPVTASATPQATQPPVTTAPGGRPPTAPGRHPGQGRFLQRGPLLHRPPTHSDGRGLPHRLGPPVSPDLPLASPHPVPDVRDRMNVACGGRSASPSVYWSSWWLPWSVRPTMATMATVSPAVRPRRSPGQPGRGTARQRAVAPRARPRGRVRCHPRPPRSPPPRPQPPPPRRRWPSPTDPPPCRPWHRLAVRPDRR